MGGLRSYMSTLSYVVRKVQWGEHVQAIHPETLKPKHQVPAFPSALNPKPAQASP